MAKSHAWRQWAPVATTRRWEAWCGRTFHDETVMAQITRYTIAEGEGLPTCAPCLRALRKIAEHDVARANALLVALMGVPRG